MQDLGPAKAKHHPNTSCFRGSGCKAGDFGIYPSPFCLFVGWGGERGGLGMQRSKVRYCYGVLVGGFIPQLPTKNQQA